MIRILTLLLLVALVALFQQARAAEPKRTKILLRSSWQTVNIGDIAHTPGILQLLATYYPEAEIVLWPMHVKGPVEEILTRNFPKVRIISKPEEVEQAFATCDFFLHSSGPSLVAEKDLARWQAQTGKPFGVYGITLAEVTPEIRELLGKARFIYFRDSVSLQVARDGGIACPVMEFGPDAAFGVKLRNDAAAEAFLRKSGLEEGKFLCVIPRYRKSPYWIMHHREMTAQDRLFDEGNQRMKEHDNKPLRDAIIAVVRQTPMKVLICPEDQSQVALGKEMLYDPLPGDVKARVVWRDNYWLTDEALSVYVRSAGLFGLEMHSPILCIGNGIPAIVCRFKEQTSKGYMWRDIGLGDWLFDMDREEEIPGIVPAVLAMAKDPAAAKIKAAQARTLVEQRQRETMRYLKEVSANRCGDLKT